MDPFETCRTVLFVFLGVYTLIVFAFTAWRLTALLAGNDPGRRLLRTYLSYFVVSIRLRPLAGELTQIALWLVVWVGVGWLHTRM